MDTILKRGAANVLAGAYSNNQATLGAELSYRYLRNGASVVALVEGAGDASVIASECEQWLRARKCDLEAKGRLAFLTNYRVYHEPAKLAGAIMNMATGAPLLVWCDLSSGPYVGPDHHWLSRAVALLDHLAPDATVLSVISTGPDGMPVPALSRFPADCIHHVSSSGVAMRVTVTPVKHSAPAIRLVGEIAEGGAVLIGPQEETDHEYA